MRQRDREKKKERLRKREREREKKGWDREISDGRHGAKKML